jgi:hypothetical protein
MFSYNKHFQQSSRIQGQHKNISNFLYISKKQDDKKNQEMNPIHGPLKK